MTKLANSNGKSPRGTYFTLKIQGAPEDLGPLITDLCFEYNCLGISEALQFHQPDLTFDARIEKNSLLHWVAYFDQPPSPELSLKLRELNPTMGIYVLEEKNRDWMEEWKKDWTSFELIPPFWVVPSWLKSPVSTKHTLKIDPGMAFGTGTHATTRMAAHLLQLALSSQTSGLGSRSKKNPLRVLDLGTGTGLLAILAERLGATEVLAVDVDPEAVRVATDNILLNSGKNILATEDSAEDLVVAHEVYDIVVANIIDGVLTKLKPWIEKLVVPKTGQLILSGILSERENLFFDQFELDQNWRILDRVQEQEWCSYRVCHK